MLVMFFIGEMDVSESVSPPSHSFNWYLKDLWQMKIKKNGTIKK